MAYKAFFKYSEIKSKQRRQPVHKNLGRHIGSCPYANNRRPHASVKVVVQCSHDYCGIGQNLIACDTLRNSTKISAVGSARLKLPPELVSANFSLDALLSSEKGHGQLQTLQMAYSALDDTNLVKNRPPIIKMVIMKYSSFDWSLIFDPLQYLAKSFVW